MNDIIGQGSVPSVTEPTSASNAPPAASAAPVSAGAPSARLRWSSLLFGVVLFIAFLMVVDGWLYAFLGIDAAIQTIARLFRLTYPVVDGKEALPLFVWAPQVFHAHAIALYVHVLVSPIALLLGPLQLFSRLPKRGSKVHRLLGKVYVGAVLVGIPAGVYLGMYEGEGVMATMGFFGMGLTTVTCTVLAYVAARAGDFESHRAFMIRSYVVLFFSNVILRLVIFLVLPFVAPMPQGFREPYVVSVFLSWSMGLLVADVYLYVSKAKRAGANATAR